MSEVNKTFSVGKKYMNLETYNVFECYRQRSTNGNPVRVELRRLNTTRSRVLYAVPIAILNPEDYIVVGNNIDSIQDESESFPKTGDHVQVKRSGVNEWFDRFYLFSYAGKHYTLNVVKFKNVTINTQFEHNSCWDEIRKAVEPDLKITVEINGKPAKLSDISKETLESLRSKN